MGSDTMILVFWMLSFKPTFSLSSFTFIETFYFLFTFCHKGGVICITVVIDISPVSLDSSLCFFQSSVSHDVFCIEVKRQGDNIQPRRTPFPIWNQSVVPCSVLTVASWPAYRFLKRQVRWSGIPHLFHNFPQFIVIHTVKGFGIVNKAEIDVFLELLLFPWSSRCWQFYLWFLCVFYNQLEHLGVHSSRIAEAWLGEFWALLH